MQLKTVNKETKLVREAIALVVKEVSKDIVGEKEHVPRLVFLTQEFSDKTLLLKPESKDSIVIGRSSLSDFVVEDPMISSSHCEIFRASEHSYSISDLRSKNGTYINGERLGVVRRPLIHGDVVKLGRVEMIYIDEKAPKIHHERKPVIDIEESNPIGDIKNMSPFYVTGKKKKISPVTLIVSVLMVIVAICLFCFLSSL